MSERRTELAQELAAQPPRYVVVGHGDATYFDPKDSSESLADYPALAERLAKKTSPWSSAWAD